MNTEAQIKHVFDQWHAATLKRDLEGLMALYSEDTTFESPAVFALGGATGDGIIRGRKALTEYFRNFFAQLDKDIDWYRTGQFFSDGATLTWEYPRESPKGNQVDLTETMEIKNGLITHHRVYWGWMGFKTLLEKLGKAKTS